MRILIVGAGPTGLAAGLELAEQGVMPTIIDQRESPSGLSRAVGITPRSLELLSRYQVSDRLIAEGISMKGVSIYRGDRLALELPLYSDRVYFPTILTLPQDRTEGIMSDALCARGCSVRYGVQLESLEEGNGGVKATFADGVEECFDLIVGADGVGSTVRKQAGIDYPGIDLAETWSIADVDVDGWLHPERLTIVMAGPGKGMIVAPLARDRYRVVASFDNGLRGLPLPMNVRRVRREGSFRISVRQAVSYSKGRIHLAGDAAHCHSPVGGRGMNLGIADGVELGRCIVEDRLDGYSLSRHWEGARVIQMTERARKMAAGVTGSRRIAMRVFLASLRNIGPLRRLLGRTLVEF